MADLIRLDVAQRVSLADLPTRPPGSWDRGDGEKETDHLGAELDDLLDLLFYAGQTGLLIVLQGMDTSGKDGTIRHLLSHSNAQSVRVAPFKVPTPLELAHDFLWRVHAQIPARGSIAIFNRSHYEDVLVVRVRGLAPEAVWSRRYDHIRALESLLADSGTVVLKFFLHISKDEQERRLLDREKEVEKAWKLSVGDWKERERWDDYQRAYEDALGRTADSRAPWFVVPADDKRFRDLVVTRAIVEALRPLAPGWRASLAELGAEAKAELEAYRRGGAEG